MQKIIYTLLGYLLSSYIVFADDWTIIPEDDKWGANAKNMDWEDFFEFFKHIAVFLSQIGLVIGAVMIIYAGYKYATGVFTGDASKGGKDAVKGAIYGLIVIIFAYAIMKILMSMFL